MEKWLPIKGFSGYSVSSHGRVESYKDFHGGLNASAHILQPRVNPNGYQIVTLYDSNRKPHQISVHRLVAETFNPTNDRTLVVDHLDGNKTNNHAANLEWVTNKENSVRACKAGLYEPAFEKTRRSVLVTDLWTGDEIYYSGVNDAARDLGFSASAISKAANLNRVLSHYVVEFAGIEEHLLYKNYI